MIFLNQYMSEQKKYSNWNQIELAIASMKLQPIQAPEWTKIQFGSKIILKLLKEDYKIRNVFFVRFDAIEKAVHYTLLDPFATVNMHTIDKTKKEFREMSVNIDQLDLKKCYVVK